MKVADLESKYAYSVGRVRALEAKLLDSTRVERLLDAPDIEALFGALSETDYARLLSVARTPRDYEKVLVLALEETYRLLREISPEPELVRLILVRYDFHNMKAILARKALASGDGDAGEGELAPFGYIGAASLRRAIAEGDTGILPGWCRSILARAEELREGGDPEVQDRFLDREMYRFISQEARGPELAFLAEIFSRRADLTNIETFVRCKRAGKPVQFLEESLLPGGGLAPVRFIELYDEPVESIIDALSMTDYGGVVEEGLKRFLLDGTLGAFERLMDNHLVGFIKRAKYVAFGPEPLVAYVFARENEVGILRNIFVGKANGLPQDVIRERLRDVYV